MRATPFNLDPWLEQNVNNLFKSDPLLNQNLGKLLKWDL
jgi:hypothetical protein